MKHWIGINILPRWVGFAWFGWLKMRNVKTGKTIEVSAGGVYCENGRSMEFKLSDWDENKNIDDYEITHYITRPDKIPNLFNTGSSPFRRPAKIK